MRECNVMVVVRADKSIQIRERKYCRLERAVYEHENDEGEENKLMVYSNELGVRCPIRVSSCNYESFELDEDWVERYYEECRMQITRPTHQQTTRAYCESRRVEVIPNLLKIKSAALCSSC